MALFSLHPEALKPTALLLNIVAAGVAAMFNSFSGLLRHLSSLQHVPDYAPLLAGMALVGGSLGALCGSRHLPVPAILKAMLCMLVMAGERCFCYKKRTPHF